MPSLLHRSSRVDLSNGNLRSTSNDNTDGTTFKKAEESKVDLPNGTTGPTLHQKNEPNRTVANGAAQGQKSEPNGIVTNGARVPKEQTKNTPTRKTMQDFMWEIGAAVSHGVDGETREFGLPVIWKRSLSGTAR